MCVINFVNLRPMEQQWKPRLGHTSENVRERISFSPNNRVERLSLSLSCAATAPSLSPYSVSADPPAQSRRELSLWWCWHQTQAEIDMAESDLILLRCLGYVQILRLLFCPSLFRKDPACLPPLLLCWLKHSQDLSKTCFSKYVIWAFRLLCFSLFPPS